MKRTFTLNKASKLSSNLHYYAHRLYLAVFLKSWNKRESVRHRVYDNLGMIDTLGYNSDNGRFAYSYSDELCYVFGFKFLGLNIEFVEY